MKSSASSSRSVRRRRSESQKKQTAAAAAKKCARTFCDENIPPVPVFSPPVSIPSTPFPSTNNKKIKALRDSVFYHKTTLRRSRCTALTVKEENRQLLSSLEASHDINASAANQVSIAHECLSAAKLEILEVKKRAADSIFSSNSYLTWVSQENSRVSTIQINELSRLATRNKRLTVKNIALKKRNQRCRVAIKRSLLREQRQKFKSRLHMKLKGVYTQKSRALMRTLAISGCSQKNVGSVIQSVGDLMGVDIASTVSRRTVRRTLIEGGVASSIQVGHAIAQSNCEYLCLRVPSLVLILALKLMYFLAVTFSDDATSHRHINYESRHIAIRDSVSGNPQIYFVGVEATTDHTSATQLKGWLAVIAHISATFSNSPFAARRQLALSDAVFALKLRGTNGDHASDQKKKHSMLFEWKMQMTQIVLGSSVLSQISQAQLLVLIGEAMSIMIDSLGGHNVWDRISLSEREAHEAIVAKNLALRIGASAYSTLPEQQKHEYELFFRGGCCMHKDLNAVRGGDKEMSAAWIVLGASGPISLPNKDNFATINDPSSGDTARTRATELSGRGGVKASSIAGALFNNKDKKKGQQDTYCWYFYNVLGYNVSFPDTSNTRYGSHCEAAAELIAHLPIYVEFLDFIRHKKEQATHTNMEYNLCKALRCPSTLTELCVLALYGQTVSLPYMAIVRGPEATLAGALNMGPTQMKVICHVQCFRDNLHLFTSSEASPEQSTFDGVQWRSNEVFYAIKALLPSLPHFDQVLYAFLNGALSVWERFSDDYQPTGCIGMSTTTERQGIYMPPTNDRNESALGAKRQDARIRPNHSALSSNAIVSLKRNNTEEFIALELHTIDDAQYLRSTARKLDSSGLEGVKRSEQAVYDTYIVAERKQKAKEKAEKISRLQETLDEVELTLDSFILERESKAKLELRLKKYRHLIYEVHGKTKMQFDIPVQSRITRQADRISQIVRCHNYLSCSLNSSALADVGLHTPSATNIGSNEEAYYDSVESDHDMDLI